MNFDWRQLFGSYQRMSPRERGLVAIAGSVTLLIVLYSMVWQPLVEGQASMKTRIARKQKELVEIQQMRQTHSDLIHQFLTGQQILVKDREFSLFPHIEATVGQVVSRDHIQSMNPQSKVIANAYKEESVELRLQDISLDKLVDMLYRIEKGQLPLRVTRLQVKKRAKDPHSFDVIATVSMLLTVEG